jgi:hypothetical protein
MANIKLLMSVCQFQRALCSTDTVFLVVPPSRTRYVRWTLQNAAAELWNRLPKNIRNADTFSSFKKILKTHLFKEEAPLNGSSGPEKGAKSS